MRATKRGGARRLANVQGTHLDIGLNFHQLFGKGKISYLGSGDSNHMTSDRCRFLDFAPATGHIRIGKRRLEVKGKGTTIVKMTESCGG